jgi:endonuclease/exonuclease/phosphatase family metal-dependent hydrolase
VHRCIGTDGHYRPERIAGVIASIGADIVALQEVDSSLKAADGSDQLSFIASIAGSRHVMGPTLERDYGAYGNALLTPHAIEYHQKYDLSYRRFEPRGALAAGLLVRQRRVRVVNAHLGLKYWERSFQLDRLLSDVVWRDEPLTILAGDFNEWFPYAGNSLRLSRSFGGLPRLGTFPSNWPRFALDRICIHGTDTLVRYEVVRTAETRVASDHLPLLAELSL